MNSRRRRTGLPATGVSVGILDKGGAGPVPPSAAVRVHRRVRNSAAAGVGFVRLDVADYAAGRTDRLAVLLVVRDAVPETLLDAVLRRADSDGTRIVVDVDDDLVSPAARRRLVTQGYDADRLDAFRRLMTGAHQVTVSTSHLAGVLREHVSVRALTVVPNELDPRLWLGGDLAGPDGSGGPSEGDGGEVRVLYMGSRTHREDLELVSHLPGELGARLGTDVVLEVVGVTDGGLPDGARRLVPERTHYAGFARWLRRNRRRWHAAVAPLVDSDFNLSKSDLKLLEYGALELATVASPVGPYAGADPVLARTAVRPDEWLDVLEVAVTERLDHGPAVDAAAWVATHRMMNDASLTAWRQTLLG